MATVDERLKLLVVRASFASLGGAERELMTVFREWSKRWNLTLATLQFPEHAQELVDGLDIRILKPEKTYTPPSGAMTEIRGTESKAATKEWTGISGLREAIASADVVHLSVSRGTLEILPLIPQGIGIHYHCLEPPRWLHEDVLHKRIDGTLKRPGWMTRFLFGRQRKRDIALVRELLSRSGTAISGNSHWIQSQLSRIYGLKHDSGLENGEPAPRKNGLCGGPSVLMHVVDISDWPEEEEDEHVSFPSVADEYVTTVGRISHVKGTWETLRSLEGTGIGMVQIGGGDEKDKKLLQAEATRLGVPLRCMSRLELPQLRKLVRGAVAMVSHAHGEPFGLTPLEAMMVGTPALFVDDGGFHYTMSGANSGLLLPRGDEKAWKKAYKTAKDPSLRKEWAKNGRSHVVGGFSLVVQADALQRLLEDCMEHA